MRIRNNLFLWLCLFLRSFSTFEFILSMIISITHNQRPRKHEYHNLNLFMLQSLKFRCLYMILNSSKHQLKIQEISLQASIFPRAWKWKGGGANKFPPFFGRYLTPIHSEHQKIKNKNCEAPEFLKNCEVPNLLSNLKNVWYS